MKLILIFTALFGAALCLETFVGLCSCDFIPQSHPAVWLVNLISSPGKNLIQNKPWRIQ
uniref:Uncharacterized protein n=1 Tax=Pavo cristatus TaxID=9049 RepID=A0A8C9EU29_PAVCR